MCEFRASVYVSLCVCAPLVSTPKALLFHATVSRSIEAKREEYMGQNGSSVILCNGENKRVAN